MILQSLYRYYNILLQGSRSDIAPPGYSTVGVSFALNISAQGELLDIYPLIDLVPQGKKMVERPRRMIVPAQVKRTSGIKSNLLCDNSAYVLGLSDKDQKDPEHSKQRFLAFKEFNTMLLEQANCQAAEAVIAFLDRVDDQTIKNNPAVAGHLEAILKGGNLVFQFQEKMVHEEPKICRAWEQYLSAGEFITGQCLITGEREPIARLHPSIKGLTGANTTGASIVSFNERAYESYNRTKEQGMNSPVSEKAAFAYTTALNYLLSRENPNKKIYIGDTAVVYWAESDQPGYASVFASLLEPEFLEDTPVDPQEGRKVAEERLKTVAKKVRQASPVDIAKMTEGLDEETRFFVLGLAPNAARIAIRFFLNDAFGEIVKHILQHYDDLKITRQFDNQPEFIPIRWIVDETVSKKSKNREASRAIASNYRQAVIIYGTSPINYYGYAIRVVCGNLNLR